MLSFSASDRLNPSSLLPEEFGLAFHEKLLDSLHDGVYFVDRNRKILYWNKGAEELTGYQASEVVGRYCFDNILMHVAADGCSLCLHGCPLSKTIEDGLRRENEVFLHHKLGHRVPVSVRVAPIAGKDGKIIGAVEIFSDITAKKYIERRVVELQDLVFLDALTGMPNRRYIGLKVKQAIQEVEQFDRKIGLMMVDIDHFKEVNDHYGHDIGDQALIAVSRTLSQNLRTGNVIGRWGGEEFLVIVSGTGLEGLEIYAKRCLMLIASSPIPVPNGHVRVTISVGATLIRPGDSDQAVLKRVDELMYASKADGRNRVTVG